MSVLTVMDTGAQNPYRDQALASQLGAVLTLAYGRRVQVAAGETPISMEGSEIMSFLPTNVVARELLGPIEGNPRRAFEQLLKLIAGRQRRDARVLMASIELHYGASQLYDLELNTAHTLVVAGIETLAGHFEPKKGSWNDYFDAERWDKLFVEMELTEVQRERLRSELLGDRHLRLRQRFADYVIDRLDSSFWNRAVRDFSPSLTMTENGAQYTGMSEAAARPMEHYVPRDAALLRRRLIAAYDARSRFVHAGSKRDHQGSAFTVAAGRPAGGNEPIEFIGLRRILEWLILAELRNGSAPAPLPSLRLRHGRPGARESEGLQ